MKTLLNIPFKARHLLSLALGSKRPLTSARLSRCLALNGMFKRVFIAGS